MSPLELIEYREVVERHRQVGVPRTERVLFDKPCPVVQPLRFGKVSLSLVKRCKVVQVYGDLVVVWPENALENLQCLSEQGFCLIMLSLPIENCSECGNVGRHVRVICAQSLFADDDRPACEAF